MDHAEIARELCAACRLFGERQWCLATSGNFSARVEPDQFLITKSGRQKADLDPGDLMLCSTSGAAVDEHNVPSAETPIHARLYKLDAGIGISGATSDQIRCVVECRLHTDYGIWILGTKE